MTFEKADMTSPESARPCGGGPHPADPTPPPVRELQLSRSEFEEYVGELEAHSELLELRSKRAPTTISSTPDRSQTLTELSADFKAGTLRALQLLYRVQGSEYCDTLTHASDGAIRVIRVSAKVPPDAG